MAAGCVGERLKAVAPDAIGAQSALGEDQSRTREVDSLGGGGGSWAPVSRLGGDVQCAGGWLGCGRTLRLAGPLG